VTPKLLTPRETRQILNVSLSLVYRWAEIGRLPCVRIPCPQGEGSTREKSLVRFKPEDVWAFVERHYRRGE
jgi:predicted site-specific integrase-resolvase